MLELNEPIKTRSCLHERIWSLYKSDPDAFKREATAYFAITYPNLVPINFNYHKRIVWLVERSRL